MSVLDFSAYIAERTRDFVGQERVFQAVAANGRGMDNELPVTS